MIRNRVNMKTQIRSENYKALLKKCVIRPIQRLLSTEKSKKRYKYTAPSVHETEKKKRWNKIETNKKTSRPT